MLSEEKIEPTSDIDIISDYSFKLAICELFIGSLLHTLHIPLSGQILSLNQIVFMTLVSKEFRGRGVQARAPLYVSQISAFLKSLSPAGKKLGPMLSISMQGLLFVLPQYLFSTHILSIVIGAVLSSLWAFIQPLITLYILFGHNIIKAFEHYSLKIQDYFNGTIISLWVLLLVPVLVKIILSILLSVWAYQAGDSGSVSKILKFIMSHKVMRVVKSTKKKSHSLFKEITRPIFLVSIFFTSLYIYSNKELLAPTIWSYLRPIAIGIVLLYINRSNFMIRYVERNQDKVFFQVLKRVNTQLDQVTL